MALADQNYQQVNSSAGLPATVAYDQIAAAAAADNYDDGEYRISCFDAPKLCATLLLGPYNVGRYIEADLYELHHEDGDYVNEDVDDNGDDQVQDDIRLSPFALHVVDGGCGGGGDGANASGDAIFELVSCSGRGCFYYCCGDSGVGRLSRARFASDPRRCYKVSVVLLSANCAQSGQFGDSTEMIEEVTRDEWRYWLSWPPSSLFWSAQPLDRLAMAPTRIDDLGCPISEWRFVLYRRAD